MLDFDHPHAGIRALTDGQKGRVQGRPLGERSGRPKGGPPFVTTLWDAVPMEPVPMIRKFSLLAVLAALVATAPAAAQQDQQTDDDKVVVVGRVAEDAVRDFVAEVGAAPAGQNLARWDRRVCVGAANMTPHYAQRLIDQVSRVALAIGLEIGEPGCRPNILILADRDGDALAVRLVADSPEGFRPDRTSSNLGSEALRRFQTSDAPVRWWHVTQTVVADTGEPATGGATVQVRGASRIRSNVRQDMANVIVILDTSRIGAASFSSLADYVSMIALAQVDAEADMREFPTVLNLFANETGDRTARMTQWDLDYLISLYDTRGDAANPNREARDIARGMQDQPSTLKDAAGN